MKGNRKMRMRKREYLKILKENTSKTSVILEMMSPSLKFCSNTLSAYRKNDIMFKLEEEAILEYRKNRFHQRDQLIGLLEENNGNYVKSCKELGIKPVLYHRWKKLYPDFKQFSEELESVKNDTDLENLKDDFNELKKEADKHSKAKYKDKIKTKYIDVEYNEEENTYNDIVIQKVETSKQEHKVSTLNKMVDANLKIQEGINKKISDKLNKEVIDNIDDEDSTQDQSINDTLKQFINGTDSSETD